MYGIVHSLQATLSASSAMSPPAGLTPHHPITCNGALIFDEDNYFACEHAVVGPDDVRTQFCIDHSIALLVLELAREVL